MAMTFTSNFTELVKVFSFAPFYSDGANNVYRYGSVTNLEGNSTIMKIYDWRYTDSTSTDYKEGCLLFPAFSPNVYTNRKYRSLYTNSSPSGGSDIIVLGTGTPSSYALGSALPYSVIHETSRTYNYNKELPTSTMKMVYQNISNSPITISEIATYRCVVQDSNTDSHKSPFDYPARFCMTAYEQLETPVTVPAGAYFNLTLTFTLNI